MSSVLLPVRAASRRLELALAAASPSRDAAAAHRLVLEAVEHVVAHARREEVRRRADVADGAADQRLRRARDVDAAHLDRAAGRRHQAREHLRELARAGAGPADDGDVLRRARPRTTRPRPAWCPIRRPAERFEAFSVPSRGSAGASTSACISGGATSPSLNCSTTCWYLISTSRRCWSQSISSFTGLGRSLYAAITATSAPMSSRPTITR